jgi:hypothetical protein
MEFMNTELGTITHLPTGCEFDTLSFLSSPQHGSTAAMSDSHLLQKTNPAMDKGQATEQNPPLPFTRSFLSYKTPSYIKPLALLLETQSAGFF